MAARALLTNATTLKRLPQGFLMGFLVGFLMGFLMGFLVGFLVGFLAYSSLVEVR